MFFILTDSQICDLINVGLSHGADFAEIFIENTVSNSIGILNGVVNVANSGIDLGVGIRLLLGVNSVYVYSDDLSFDNLMNITAEAAKALKSNNIISANKLNERRKVCDYKAEISPLSISKNKYVDFMMSANKYASEYNEKITQVESFVNYNNRFVKIANSRGVNIEKQRDRVRFFVNVVATKGNEKQTQHIAPGSIKGYEFIESYPIIDATSKCCDSVLRMLDAGYAPSGKMPVVIGNAFGGVIFHEACGHALEATSVGIGSSCFCNKMGQKIASDIVSARDNARLEGEWGSYLIDDEGNDSSNLLLIENGILKNYLVDELGSRRMPEFKPTGCSRRENYTYAPTSRMSNTYIENGKDDPKDIISDTEYGLYAAEMGGGSVDPASGEFNFSVSEGYMIRNGKLAEPVRGATLIGKGAEVLLNIDRVGNDLKHAAGVCGSLSGNVPTNVGQPTIRVSSILVGGRE